MVSAHRASCITAGPPPARVVLAHGGSSQLCSPARHGNVACCVCHDACWNPLAVTRLWSATRPRVTRARRAQAVDVRGGPLSIVVDSLTMAMCVVFTVSDRTHVHPISW